MQITDVAEIDIYFKGFIAQLVEQWTENPCAQVQLLLNPQFIEINFASVTQTVECLTCNEDVAGSIPVAGSK